MGRIRRYTLTLIVGAGLLMALFVPKPAAAASGEFSLQVYPSPLVATVKPGQATTLELKVRNSGTAAEDLKILPRAFKIGQDQALELSDDQLPDIASWINFATPTFTVQAGQTATQKVTLNVPKEAGFSYSFAIIISRANDEAASSGRTLKGSVAVFTLINVDRPGAVRAVEVTKFTSTHGSYEYLPAEFQIEFKNTGNTIVQPSGNIFIQRGENDATPIDVLPVNKSGGYILPGTTRTLSVKWANGFQVITDSPQPDGGAKKDLAWNWNKLSSIRIGSYTAKLVAIYDDGHRDVALQASTSFWVVPWLMLLGILLVIALVGAGIWSLVHNMLQFSKKFHRKKMRF